MTDLRKAAQQALEALKAGVSISPGSVLHDQFRTALGQQAEPVSHAVIVGALFDFMGWLTTRKERLVLSSTDNASPAADAIKAFAEMRGLSLDDARVQNWQNYTTPPQQQVEPVAWQYKTAEAGIFVSDQLPQDVQVWQDIEWSIPLYTAPPQREWDKPNASFNDWWNGDYDDAANPFEKDSAAYWAWAGWQAAQRQWVGLTDEEVNRESAPIAQKMKLAFHAGMYVAQQILKDKNNG